MGNPEWQTTGQGDSFSYIWKDFEIRRHSIVFDGDDESEAVVTWNLFHHGIKVGATPDLLDAMTYCESIDERLTA